MQALADHRSETRELVTQRLTMEFARLSTATVERCIADVQACMTHLGVDATPALVERIAREHLVGVVKSEPPSGFWGVRPGRDPDVPGPGAGR